MKYLVLVSHGTFAEGLKSVMLMLAGEQAKEIIAVGLEDGMSAEEFAEKFAGAISHIKEEDEIILLGDLIGGSPLTNAIEQISNKGMLDKTVNFWRNESGNGSDGNTYERRGRYGHAEREPDQRGKRCDQRVYSGTSE